MFHGGSMYISFGITTAIIHLVSATHKPVSGVSEVLALIPSGIIVGSVNETWTGKIYYSFRGIPFAEPPIGDLRFKATVSVKPWKDIKKTTKEGPVCYQINSDIWDQADEDCLFLNVYTDSIDGNKPVIVFFHPGTFYSMTAASSLLGPDYLLDHDVVLVTVNYRLDALGYLTTGDKHAGGNNGFKDQVEALRWIQKHIRSLGGDPNQVTIAGYSAGSRSALLHMLSPMSKGLFHKVIAMSAGVTSNWVTIKNPLRLTKKLAGLLNCSTDSSEVMVKCLRDVPAKDLNNKFNEMRILGGIPVAVFGPVIEPDLDNDEERFLTDEPENIIKSKQFNHVPVVTGITEYEFLSWSQRILRNETLSKYLIENFDSLAPSLFSYDNKNKEEAQKITKQFKKFYFGKKPISKDSVYELGKWFSDYSVIFSEYTTAKLLSKFNDRPVYFYKFSYKGRHSHMRDLITNKTIGPVHHDDLIYLFYMSVAYPKLRESDPDAFMVKLETSFWKNFATNGNPTPDGSPVQWLPVTYNDEKYLDINSKLTMVKGLPFPERMTLWNKIFPVL
ncbi:esterase E4-like [Lycorma delicatula]|uniref:esterase E4-like n=1 Tax=Lycorma delicatula TaxID=130591 RepID=UPI003F50FD6A